MTSSRDIVLQRVRAALADGNPGPDVKRAYRTAGEAADSDRGAVLSLFAARASEYRAVVHETTDEELAGLLARLVAGQSVVAVRHLAELLPDGARLDDPPLGVGELERCDTVVTGCRCAIAETGTVVLDGGAESGRRVTTLLPDHHVCVVRGDQIVATVPDAIAALAPAAASGLPITFVSGPSATSDIELERVEGVHGPRRLEIVIAEPAG